MTHKIIFFLLIASFFAFANAHAQENVPQKNAEQNPEQTAAPSDFPPPDFTGMTGPKRVTVRNVIDNRTLTLADGRALTLTGLDFPDSDPENPGAYSVAAMSYLKEHFEGQPVSLYQTPNSDKGRMNRMGHMLGHLYLDNKNIWAQGALVAQGLARVRVTPNNPEMAEQLYEREKQARQKGAGLWSEDSYSILTPETALEAREGFQIIEGTVKNVATVRNRIYLNFGPDWRTDLTVGIEAADRRKFLAEDLNPMDWNNRHIRYAAGCAHGTGRLWILPSRERSNSRISLYRARTRR